MLVETSYFGGVINPKTYLNHELGSKFFFLSDLAYKLENLLVFEKKSCKMSKNWTFQKIIGLGLNFRWSSPEKGENFTDSASSTPSSCSEFTNPSLRGELNLNMNSGVLELKLHEVHFADKFSGAELAWRRRTCLQSAPSAVSTPMSTRR